MVHFSWYHSPVIDYFSEALQTKTSFRMKAIRTLFFAAFITCLLPHTAFSQTEIGGGLVFGSDIEELGITLDGNFYISDQFSISPNLTFFFAEDPVNFFTINADGRYNFEVGSETIVYPLGGLNLAFTSIDTGGFGGDTSNTELGINLGGGINYFFSDNLGILGELKFVVGDADQIVLTGGITYRFE